MRYASDITDAQWGEIERHISGSMARERLRENSLRAVANAVFHVVQTGHRGRMLPSDLPPFATVQRHWYVWGAMRRWQENNHIMLMAGRDVKGRDAGPSVGVFYSQSAKTSEIDGPNSCAEKKMVKRSKSMFSQKRAAC